MFLHKNFEVRRGATKSHLRGDLCIEIFFKRKKLYLWHFSEKGKRHPLYLICHYTHPLPKKMESNLFFPLPFSTFNIRWSVIRVLCQEVQKKFYTRISRRCTFPGNLIFFEYPLCNTVFFLKNRSYKNIAEIEKTKSKNLCAGSASVERYLFTTLLVGRYATCKAGYILIVFRILWMFHDTHHEIWNIRYTLFIFHSNFVFSLSNPFHANADPGVKCGETFDYIWFPWTELNQQKCGPKMCHGEGRCETGLYG